jgi:hypothetical protein
MSKGEAPRYIWIVPSSVEDTGFDAIITDKLPPHPEAVEYVRADYHPTKLSRQSVYPLEECLKELRFSRPVRAQGLINKFIAVTALCRKFGLRTTFDWDTITTVWNKPPQGEARGSRQKEGGNPRCAKPGPTTRR